MRPSILTPPSLGASVPHTRFPLSLATPYPRSAPFASLILHLHCSIASLSPLTPISPAVTFPQHNLALPSLETFIRNSPPLVTDDDVANASQPLAAGAAEADGPSSRKCLMWLDAGATPDPDGLPCWMDGVRCTAPTQPGYRTRGVAPPGALSVPVPFSVLSPRVAILHIHQNLSFTVLLPKQE